MVNDGHDGITVRDGSVRDFASGVLVGRARRNRLLGVSSSRNQFFGFVIAESTRSLVRDSAGDDNPGPDGDGIGIFASRRLRILSNSFRRNASACTSRTPPASRSRATGSHATPHMGILMEADRNRYAATAAPQPGVHRRRPRQPKRDRRQPGYRDNGGIAIEKGRGNLVPETSCCARAGGSGWGGSIPRSAASGPSLRGNVVRGSGRDRSWSPATTATAVLHGNTAIGARDGFDVGSPRRRTTANRAIRNADLGIEAVPGVLDAGGNSARHNGDPRQCTNIRCG